MKHARIIFLAVIATLGLAAIAIVSAQDGNSANVEVRVWQSTRDAERLWISARPEGGSWATLGTIPLGMGEENSRGTLRYEDITLAVPVPGAQAIDESETCRWVLGIANKNPNVQVLSCEGFPEMETVVVADERGDPAGTEEVEVINPRGILRAYGETVYFQGKHDWFIRWNTNDTPTNRSLACAAVEDSLSDNFRLGTCNASATLHGSDSSVSWSAWGILVDFHKGNGDGDVDYSFDIRRMDDNFDVRESDYRVQELGVTWWISRSE